MPAPRPLPRLDPDNRFFWTGGEDGSLRFLRCADCASFIHPPRPVCFNCLCENLAPEVVPGTGTVVSFTINRQKWSPDMEVPFIIARIAIDGAPGVILTSNIIDCAVEDVRIGDKVAVCFERQEDVFLPLFRKV